MTARALHIPLSPLKKQQQLLGKALAHCADTDEADVYEKRFVGDGCEENRGICFIDYVFFVLLLLLFCYGVAKYFLNTTDGRLQAAGCPTNLSHESCIRYLFMLVSVSNVQMSVCARVCVCECVTSKGRDEPYLQEAVTKCYPPPSVSFSLSLSLARNEQLVCGLKRFSFSKAKKPHSHTHTHTQS